MGKKAYLSMMFDDGSSYLFQFESKKARKNYHDLVKKWDDYYKKHKLRYLRANAVEVVD